jgi:hypothetical protein
MTTHDTPEAALRSCAICGVALPEDWQMAVCSLTCSHEWDRIAKSGEPLPTTPDTPEAVSGTICKCGLAKSYHPRLADHDYEPRYPTHDTPEAALAAALAVEFGKAGFFRPGASMEFLTEQARMMLHDALAALPDWTLVPRVATADWTGSTRKDAEIARLRAALQRVTSVYERPAGRGKAVEHLIDEGHEIGAPCFICAALALAPSEP